MLEHLVEKSGGGMKAWQRDERLPTCSLREAFTRYLDVTTPLKQMLLERLAPFCTNTADRERMELIAKVKYIKIKICVSWLEPVPTCLFRPKTERRRVRNLKTVLLATPCRRSRTVCKLKNRPYFTTRTASAAPAPVLQY